MGEEEVRQVETALLTAEAATTPAQRYVAAQLAALRVAAVVIAARGRPSGSRGRRNAWDLVAELAPEFAEWAGFFATTQVKQQVVAAGASALVSEREADDLLRDARAFHHQVVAWLARANRARRTG